MRIAVIADIHGNIRALEAVEADIESYSPDAVLNLGDHLSGPLQAAGTADLLMTRRYVNIRGNHDRQLLQCPSEMGPSDFAARAQLSLVHRQWLETLPATARFDPDILLCHGTPASDKEYLLEDITPDGLVPAADADVAARLGLDKATVVLCGHSHLARNRKIGATHFVNPGSVGLQAYTDSHPCIHHVEVGTPHARYVIADFKNGDWTFEQRVIEYDWKAASKNAADNGRPDWAYALATGRALRNLP
jgi:putative phosphoesterase